MTISQNDSGEVEIVGLRTKCAQCGEAVFFYRIAPDGHKYAGQDVCCECYAGEPKREGEVK